MVWTVYFPFSSSEVASLLNTELGVIQSAIASRNLGQSIYSTERTNALVGQHNFIDVVNFQISQSSPFAHPDTFPGFDDFYDILIEEEESLDTRYVEALAHRDPLRLYQILLDRGWDGLLNPDVDGSLKFSELELQACSQWVKNYIVFALVACEL